MPTQRVSSCFSSCDDFQFITISCSCRYMAITIHYIDEYFISHNYVMSFDALRESHTGAVIAKLLYKNLKDWNVAGKMLTITLDNVSANYKAMRDIKVEYQSDNTVMLFQGKYSHGRCVAHIINLAVQDALKLLKHALAKLRKLVIFCRIPQNKITFEDFVTKYQRELRNDARPFLDVVVRWYSTADFLKALAMLVHRQRAAQFLALQLLLNLLSTSLAWSSAVLRLTSVTMLRRATLWSRASLIATSVSPLSKATRGSTCWSGGSSTLVSFLDLLSLHAIFLV